MYAWHIDKDEEVVLEVKYGREGRSNDFHVNIQMELVLVNAGKLRETQDLKGHFHVM